MRWLLPFLPPEIRRGVVACREHFILAAWLSALVNILYLAPTVYMMQIYDRIIPTGGILTLFWITIVVGFALGTLALLDSLRMKLMVRASLRLERMMASEILDSALSRQGTGGDVAATSQAMRDFDSVRSALSGQPALVTFDIPWTPIYVVVAFIIHPLLALFILCGGGMLLGVTILNEKHTREQQLKGLANVARFYAQQERVAAQGEMVRALGMRKAVVARQLAERHRGLIDGSAAQIKSARYVAGAKFLRLMMQSLALGLGAWLAVNRQISPGAIVASSILLSRALQPVEQLVAALPLINQARSSLSNLSRLLEASNSANAEKTRLPDPTGQIALDNVSVLAGPAGPVLLRGISFSAQSGQIVGIIGPTGAGKSTLARVLCGGLPPNQGTVRIDGANMVDWNPELLAQHVGYLPQHCEMLPGTIAENISRFSLLSGQDRDVVDKQVVEAAKKSGVHHLILSRLGGYDRQLDIGGLSIGQQQRLGLARALYGDPVLLVLDEPNSAQDAEGEAALAAAIVSARERGALVFLVAHRSGILGLADQLLVLNNGEIERFGAKDKIVASLGVKTRASNVVGLKGS